MKTIVKIAKASLAIFIINSLKVQSKEKIENSAIYRRSTSWYPVVDIALIPEAKSALLRSDWSVLLQNFEKKWPWSTCPKRPITAPIISEAMIGLSCSGRRLKIDGNTGGERKQVHIVRTAVAFKKFGQAVVHE